MASVFRRKGQTRWSYRWTDEHGQRRSGTGTTDKQSTLKIAQKLEAEALLVREGIIDRRDTSAQKAACIPLHRHVEEYRLFLMDKGDTDKHARHVAGALIRLCELAGAHRMPEITQDAISGALRRLKEKRSSRTANHALGAIRAFLRWCYQSDRLKEIPSWIRSLRPYNERVDQRRIRRSLTVEEVIKLISSTAVSADWHGITGLERAALYRLAIATGLRANELRTLEHEAFVLDGDDPVVIVRAAYSKHRREDVQPIRRADVPWLRNWLAFREGKRVLVVPQKTAEMLRHDLEASGIAVETPEGMIDFHALRATYITLLVNAGVDPKRVQKLARHSTITLTLDRYAKTTAQDIRQALEMGINES